MREILFRAKAINRDPNREYRTDYKNGDWVYGLIEKLPFYDEKGEKFFEKDCAHMRNISGVSDIDVDENTICEYTGLKDKNGNEIFEGDIIIYTNNQNGVYEIGKKMKGFIVFDEYNQCYISRNNFQKDMNWQYAENVEVIGNIWDNRDLINEN